MSEPKLLTTLAAVIADATHHARKNTADHTFGELLDIWHSVFALVTRSKTDLVRTQQTLVGLASAAMRLAAFGDKGSGFVLEPWEPCSHEVACGEFSRGGWVRAEGWTDGLAIRAVGHAAECNNRTLTPDDVRYLSAQLLHDRTEGGARGLAWQRHPEEEIPF